MTELSFLIDLLINHKLPRAVKELIVERIKLLDQLPQQSQRTTPPTRAYIQHSRADLVPPPMPDLPTIPVEQIAQTPEAAAAIASRNAAIANGLSGKIPKGQERPRKW